MSGIMNSCLFQPAQTTTMCEDFASTHNAQRWVMIHHRFNTEPHAQCTIMSFQLCGKMGSLELLKLTTGTTIAQGKTHRPPASCDHCGVLSGRPISEDHSPKSHPATRYNLSLAMRLKQARPILRQALPPLHSQADFEGGSD